MFVFGSQKSLSEFNLRFIDENVDLSKAILKSKVDKKCIQTELVYKKLNIIKKHLKQTKSSVIKDLSSVLYKLQNKELRAIYRSEIFKAPEILAVCDTAYGQLSG